MFGFFKKPNPIVTNEPTDCLFDNIQHTCITLRDQKDVTTNNLVYYDTSIQFAVDINTKKYIGYLKRTDQYTIVQAIRYGDGDEINFDTLTSEFDAMEAIDYFNFAKKRINKNKPTTHITLYTRNPTSEQVEVITNYIKEKEDTEKRILELRRKTDQRKIDIDTIQEEYGMPMPLMEVEFTDYTELGIDFSTFRVELITESDNTTREHFFVCITFNSNVNRDAVAKYDIKEYSTVKFYRFNNQRSIYLNEDDEKACRRNVTTLVKKLNTLSRLDSITLFLFKPNDRGLVELPKMKYYAEDEAQGPRGEAGASGASGASREAGEVGETGKQDTTTKQHVSLTQMGGVHGHHFINGLTNRRKFIKRRKSIKRRKPIKKRRATKKKNKKTTKRRKRH